jgi:DNA-3-methyladenine glycosylase II
MNKDWYVHPLEERVQVLCQADPHLQSLVDVVGTIHIPLDRNRFASLVHSIIGQQLSAKAAATIRQRVEELVQEWAPERILSHPDEALRLTGLSNSKIQYIKDLCHKLIGNELDLYQLDHLENQEIIEALKKVKGIGQWTAEMFLIFSLGRTDVLSTGDAGLQKAARWLYQVENALERKREQWHPYESIASLYLWEAVDRGYVNRYGSILDCVQGVRQIPKETST